MKADHPMRPLFDRLFALRDECNEASKGRRLNRADKMYSMGVADGYSLAAALLDKHVVKLLEEARADRAVGQPTDSPI